MKPLSILLLMLCALPCSFSQDVSSDVISTSGGSIVLEDFVMSWTIGENIIDFSQISPDVTTSSESLSGTIKMNNGILIKVYPVVTTGPITIDIESEDSVELNAGLFNMKGSLLKIKKLNSDKEDMELDHLADGMYMLRIADNELKDMKIVKIIKQ